MRLLLKEREALFLSYANYWFIECTVFPGALKIVIEDYRAKSVQIIRLKFNTTCYDRH